MRFLEHLLYRYYKLPLTLRKSTEVLTSLETINRKINNRKTEKKKEMCSKRKKETAINGYKGSDDVDCAECL